MAIVNSYPIQSRKIGTSRRALTGEVLVKGSLVPFESSLERDFLITCDYSSDVKSVVAQPNTVKYRDKTGKLRRYTPDFFVENRNGIHHVVEVKYQAELLDSFHLYRERFKAAIKYYKDQPYTAVFKLKSEKQIRALPHWENVSFLRKFNNVESSKELELDILNTIRVMDGISPSGVLEYLFKSDASKAQALPFLWNIIATGKVSFDINEKLSMNSPLWVVEGV